MKKIIYPLALSVMLLGGGTFFFSIAESWSYVDAFYFSTMTLTTIGFGDLTPTHPVTKIVTSFYAIFGIAIMLYLLTTVMGGYVGRHEQYFDRVIASLHKIKPSEIRRRYKRKDNQGFHELK